MMQCEILFQNELIYCVHLKISKEYQYLNCPLQVLAQSGVCWLSIFLTNITRTESSSALSSCSAEVWWLCSELILSTMTEPEVLQWWPCHSWLEHSGGGRAGLTTTLSSEYSPRSGSSLNQFSLLWSGLRFGWTRSWYKVSELTRIS